MDRKVILKALFLSFLPIIVYIIIEAEFGPIPGMVAAFIMSILEMGWIWHKENRIEKFLLVDMAFILVLGGTAIAFSDPFFFKLKPAIFEAVFLVIIGLSLWARIPIIQSMTSRQIRDTGLKIDFEHPQYKKMMHGLFLLFAAHIIAILWTAYFASTEVWGFVSGALLYIVMGIWLLGQVGPKYIKPVFWKFRYRKEEWFPVVDPASGKIAFFAPRPVVHANKNWLHPVVHVNIFNGKNQWFLQQRSFSKDKFPGFWDVSIGGHVQKGESIRAAATREAWEELNLRLELAEKPNYIYQIELPGENELVHVYLVRTEVMPIPDPHELHGGKFWNYTDIRRELGSAKFTPTLKAEFDILEKNRFFNLPMTTKKKKKARRK